MKSLLVIMPVYNNVKYVRNAIDSVLKQDYKNLHLVIVDDCSTDGSREIVEEYESVDNVTVLYNRENRGCYYSRNRGLDIFKDGDWEVFTVHDSDDVSFVSRCSIIMEYFESDITSVYPSFLTVDDTLTPIRKDDGNLHIFLNSEGIAFYTREIFENLGYYYNTRYAGDSEYMIRVLAYHSSNNTTHKIKYCDDILYYRILHDNNLTKSKDRDTSFILECREDIKKNMIPTKNFYREKFG